MWRLLHWAFGWDYIAWNNSAASGVARLWRDGAGRLVYWRYRSISIIDEVKDPQQVHWLTCSSAKYFPSAEALARSAGEGLLRSLGLDKETR